MKAIHNDKFRHGIMCECASVAAEDLSQIVEGYVDIIKIMVWKPISLRVSTQNYFLTFS